MSMHDDMIDELRKLQQMAVGIAAIPDRRKRQAAGLWLNHECEDFEERYRPFSGSVAKEVEVSFKAVIKILVDYILFDALEDEDWQAIMPEKFDGDLEAVLKGAP